MVPTGSRASDPRGWCLPLRAVGGSALAADEVLYPSRRCGCGPPRSAFFVQHGDRASAGIIQDTDGVETRPGSQQIRLGIGPAPNDLLLGDVMSTFAHAVSHALDVDVVSLRSDEDGLHVVPELLRAPHDPGRDRPE